MELEKVQNESPKIVTGCTKLVSLDYPINEAGWKKHKLILFFKMIKGINPALVPDTVGTG